MQYYTMQTSALASGSSGNSFFVQANGTSLLIDAGISCKEVESRMEKIGKDVSSLKGIFITHEHGDHIKGVDVLARKYSVPVYITRKCYDACSRLVSDSDLLHFIEKDKVMDFNGVKILPFSKHHDAFDPVSYCILCDGKKIGVMTDIGMACGNVISHIKDSDLLYLESNHDTAMLQEGSYPAHLKQRIISDGGHLSNYTASLLILQHASSRLQHVVLSHLSEENNTDKIALKTMKSLLQHRKDLEHLQIHLSSKHEPTELFTLSNKS